MKNKSGVSTWIISRVLFMGAAVGLAACAGGNNNGDMMMNMATPTVDYVEQLDVYSAPHQDSFLNQLAMNYRSYAIYNARTSGYPDMGEYFAQKAVAAFSGEVPFPETVENWPADNDQDAFELTQMYNELMEELKNDATARNPQLAAEAQAKYDCWVSAAASGQTATANECRDRFQKTMAALRDCDGGKVVQSRTEALCLDCDKTEQVKISIQEDTVVTNASNRPKNYYPDTRSMSAMNGTAKAREGVIIVNNVNVPEHLINPVPVQPMVFNQNIYGGDKTVSNSNNDSSVCLRYAKSGGNCLQYAPTIQQTVPQQGVEPDVGAAETVATEEAVADEFVVADVQPQPQYVEEIPMIGDELVTREEFINMMMAMRSELAAINARLDKLQAAADEKTIIKVQQIPLEPKQHVMEEVFEIRFDFNKATIKPEYQELIRKLATATQENKNIKVSVVGHTDTMGSSNYNYALGGRRADAVQKMLIKYGIPASQIVAVSAGEEDLAVPTADGVANAANRRVQVIKEVHYTEDAPQSMTVYEEYPASAECGMYGCNE